MHLLFPLAAALLGGVATVAQVRPPSPKTAAAAPKATAPRPAATAPVQPAPAAPVRETFAVRVSGSVITAEGLPLPGATVWDSATRQMLAVTNAQGEFTLTLPTNDAVTLTCGYAGYGDQHVRLRQPHRNNDLLISLEPVAAAKAR